MKTSFFNSKGKNDQNLYDIKNKIQIFDKDESFSN